MIDHAALRAVLRTDLESFIRKVFNTVSPGDIYRPNWHIEAIAHHLTACIEGDKRRLIINQPPRSLKSISASVALPAFMLGHGPARRIIVVSYSHDLAKELHRQFRLVVESDWYRALFPAMRIKKATDLELVTTDGGGRLATSVGGTLTGRGADVIIIDDPVKADEAMSENTRKGVLDWYSGTLVSRLNDKDKGAIILVMQRLHEEDLSGYLLAGDGWTHLNLPAIALEDERIAIGKGRYQTRRAGDLLQPDREGHAVLEKIKADMGSLLFSAQYQQQPIPAEGNIIKRDWFRWVEKVPDVDRDPDAPGYVVQSWDVAMTVGDANDYSVCNHLAGGEEHLHANRCMA